MVGNFPRSLFHPDFHHFHSFEIESIKIKSNSYTDKVDVQVKQYAERKFWTWNWLWWSVTESFVHAHSKHTFPISLVQTRNSPFPHPYQVWFPISWSHFDPFPRSHVARMDPAALCQNYRNWLFLSILRYLSISKNGWGNIWIVWYSFDCTITLVLL